MELEERASWKHKDSSHSAMTECPLGQRSPTFLGRPRRSRCPLSQSYTNTSPGIPGSKGRRWGQSWWSCWARSLPLANKSSSREAAKSMSRGLALTLPAQKGIQLLLHCHLPKIKIPPATLANLELPGTGPVGNRVPAELS